MGLQTTRTPNKRQLTMPPGESIKYFKAAPDQPWCHHHEITTSPESVSETDPDNAYQCVTAVDKGQSISLPWRNGTFLKQFFH